MAIWTRVIGGLGLLVAATWVAQILLARSGTTRGAARQVWRRDLAPIVAFFGILLLALSFIEAARRDVIAAWGGGGALGVIVSAFVLAALVYRKDQPARTESTLRLVWRWLRQYGALGLAALIGLYLAVRFFGAGVEVFVAGAFGMFILAIAVAALAINKQRLTEE